MGVDVGTALGAELTMLVGFCEESDGADDGTDVLSFRVQKPQLTGHASPIT